MTRPAEHVVAALAATGFLDLQLGGSENAPAQARNLRGFPQHLVRFASACGSMLQCTMNSTTSHLQLGLEDLLGDLVYARRTGDVGRVALLAYCELRRWARLAGEEKLAEQSAELITQTPHASRQEFMAHVDELIVELERTRERMALPPAAPRA